MKKNISIIIAATNAFLTIGTCGALECDAISLGTALIRCIVFIAVFVIASRIARNEQRVEDEEARRSADRAARRAERDAFASCSSRRSVRSVELARR